MAIINNVEVSECRYYIENNINFNCSIGAANCSDNPNCYYKQLQKVKGVNGSIHPDSAYYKIAMLRCKNDKLEKSNFNLCILIYKYRRAFEEIKNMLSGECFNKNQCNYCPHNNANLCTCNIAIKISEVLK